MKFPCLAALVTTVLVLGACGGGGSKSSQQAVEVPARIIIEDIALEAGVPMGAIITLPKPADPYTEITIDIGRTLENANITVTTQ